MARSLRSAYSPRAQVELVRPGGEWESGGAASGRVGESEWESEWREGEGRSGGDRLAFEWGVTFTAFSEESRLVVTALRT